MAGSSAAAATASGRDRDADTASRRGKLSSEQRRLVALLGLPTFALALSLTVVTTYLPVVAADVFGSRVFIGLIVGMEGLMALWVPLVAGTWSDQLRTRWGGRLPFLIAGTPVLAGCAAALGFVRTPGLIAGLMATFLIAYFVAYEPYRALYPDAMPDEVEGRAQSVQALFRGLGTATALLGGGLLLSIAEPVPFAVTAAVAAAILGTFAVALVKRGVPGRGPETPGYENVRAAARHLFSLLRKHATLREFMAANALWEMSIGALKTWVILYISRGLGFSLPVAAGAVGIVAVFVLIAAGLSGKIGDHEGRLRTMQYALPVYGVGLIVPFLVTNPWVVGVVAPVVGLGGGVVMALPYSILTPLMPDEDHGALTGFYTFSRGVGIGLGPLLAGVAISVLSGPFSGTQGYQAMWGVCAAAVLTSLVFVRRLRRRTAELREAGT
jgi:MFS family permease